MTKYLPGNAKRVGTQVAGATNPLPAGDLLAARTTTRARSSAITDATAARKSSGSVLAEHRYGDRIGDHPPAHDDPQGAETFWLNDRTTTGLFYLHARSPTTSVHRAVQQRRPRTDPYGDREWG